MKNVPRIAINYRAENRMNIKMTFEKAQEIQNSPFLKKLVPEEAEGYDLQQ